MFDIGMQELIVIFVVALLVFGPKKLPELARSLGRGMGELKRSFQDVKDQVKTEFEETNKTIDSTTEDIKDSCSDRTINDSKRIADNNTR
ncbi:MAG: Sec-independent protein translocase protein TatB [Nitrospirota bacterium]